MNEDVEKLDRQDIIVIVAGALTEAYERGIIECSTLAKRAKRVPRSAIEVPADAQFQLIDEMCDEVNLHDALMDMEEVLKETGREVSFTMEDILLDGHLPATVGEFADRVIGVLARGRVNVDEAAQKAPRATARPRPAAKVPPSYSGRR